jgi:mannose-6-phosphate isomerase-like protein (cupin superfamily)
MANQAQRAATEPSAPPWRLTEALSTKLGELRALGHELLWIEACGDDLTRLVMEGGEDAVRLDPDPGVDRAWFGDVEIRHTTAREMTWVFLRGEAAAKDKHGEGEISAHIVSPPD